jgi:CheY-like chemotaxis protein
MLEDLGHSVEAIADGASLLGRLEAAPDSYDLIVTDYAMPVISGGEIMERARGIRPGMPGIIISGYADAKSIGRKPRDVIALGKPFSQEQIGAAIRTVCPGQAGKPAAG